MRERLSDHVVVVTGAGAGIGRGVALACAAEGAVVVAATRGENGRDLVEEIRERGDRASWVRCDVSDATQVRETVATTLDEYGHLDAVVHNATSARSSEPHALLEADRNLLKEHMAVSLRGAFLFAESAHSALRSRAGSFVVMTSPAGIEGSATLPLYATMKGALRGFAKSLAREWGPEGITVNAVSPLGYSPAMKRAVKADPAMEGRFARRIPLNRIGDPESDVGPGLAFLIGPDARYLTGQTIGIDGGQFTSL